VAQENLVQVKLKDQVFVQLPLNFQREKYFFEFSGECFF
jgi:hypothetical protein